MKEALDEQEKSVLKELIKNPRISDNKIAKKTKIPVKTVNRKRKILEAKNILSYYASVDNSRKGTGIFQTKHMYVIKFRKGITRANFMNFANKNDFALLFQKHTSDSFIAESDGCLHLVLFIESYLETDIIEIFNADYFAKFESLFGKDCITDVKVMIINGQLQAFHNYFPNINIKDGAIRESWNGDAFIY